MQLARKQLWANHNSVNCSSSLLTRAAFWPNFHGHITLSRVITYYRYHCPDNQSLNLLRCSLRQITNRWMWIRCPNKLKGMQEGRNHNNRVSANHQALLQWQRDGKAGVRGLYLLLGRGNMRKMIWLKWEHGPCDAIQPLHIQIAKETAGQHYLNAYV